MIVIYYFLLHFIADFLLQSREMGKNKSSSIKYLAAHIAIIFSVFAVGTLNLEFAFWNAIIHMVIDACIWKGYAFSVWRRRHSILGHTWEPTTNNDWIAKKKLKEDFKYWEDPLFYKTIGLDQFLHGATILYLLETL